MTPDLPAYLDAQLAAIEDTARAALAQPFAGGEGWQEGWAL